jgi:DnaJ-class molecular chaperone
MAKRVLTAVSKMPSESCPACHGFGSVRMTAHFHSGDTEFEVPCWECFGHDVAVQFPKPRQTDNA